MDGVFGGIASYSDLLKSIGKSVEMRFSSPLSFKRRGINVPIPDPLLVYGSLWQKWQALSDVQVDEAVYEEMIESVALSGMDGHTRVWKFPHNMFVGFVGVAKYELIKKVSDDSEKLFGALSQLAFFTGVGAKTTMGLGQCKILQMSDYDDSDTE